MKYAQLVIGPAGCGKSTYCSIIQEHCTVIGRSCKVLNLDPAAETFKYECSFDIRDIVTLDDITEAMDLGPNGGLVEAMEYVVDNLTDLEEGLDWVGDDDFLLLDCPGQIELYTHLSVMRDLVVALERWDYRVIAIYCMDVSFVSDPSKFLSGALSTLSAMIRLEVPYLSVLTKCDLLGDRTEEIENMLAREPFEIAGAVSGVFGEKYRKLHWQICSLLTEFSLVQFVTLNYNDESSINECLRAADHAIQYGEDLEPKTDFDMNANETGSVEMLMQKKAPPKRKWSLTIRKNRLQRELEEMIQLVESLEGDLLEGSGMTSEDKNKEDEFMKIKRQILELVESTKDNVRSRHLLQQTQGNTVEVIQKGAQINSSLRSLDELFQAMKEAFKRQTRLKKQFDEQQLDVRFKDMQMLKHQIEECRNLASNAAGFTENELMQMTDFRSQMEQFGIELPKGKGEYREPNAEEQGAMQRWAERDQQFDHQIDEIGQVVDRLGDIAIRIGEKADQQNLIAMDLCRQADAANEELLNVNAKVHAVLKKGGPSMHFFLKLVLTLTFLGLLGWLFNLVAQRIGF